MTPQTASKSPPRAAPDAPSTSSGEALVDPGDDLDDEPVASGRKGIYFQVLLLRPDKEIDSPSCACCFVVGESVFKRIEHCLFAQSGCSVKSCIPVPTLIFPVFISVVNFHFSCTPRFSEICSVYIRKLYIASSF